MAETIRKFESYNILYPVNHCGLVKTNDISEYQPSLEELEKTAEMIRSEIRDQQGFPREQFEKRKLILE